MGLSENRMKKNWVMICSFWAYYKDAQAVRGFVGKMIVDDPTLPELLAEERGFTQTV